MTTVTIVRSGALLSAAAFWIVCFAACDKSSAKTPAAEMKKPAAPASAPPTTAMKPADPPKKVDPPPPPPTVVKLVGHKANGSATIQQEKVTVDLKGADPGQYAIELYRNVQCKSVDHLKLPPEAQAKANPAPNAPHADTELGVVSVGKDKTGHLETQVKGLKIDKNEEIVVFPKADAKAKMHTVKAAACGEIT